MIDIAQVKQEYEEKVRQWKAERFIESLNKPKIPGISFNKAAGKWTAKSYANIYLGRYDSYEEAVCAQYTYRFKDNG